MCALLLLKDKHRSQADHQWAMANAEQQAVKVLLRRVKHPAIAPAGKDKDA